MSARFLTIEIDTPWDESPDVSWLEQTPAQLGSLEAAVFNRRRLLALERGEWALIGVRLRATIELTSTDDVPNPGWRTNTLELTTPGIWEVESDSGSGYFAEIARDEADYLREDLRALGFSDAEISEAMKDALVD